MPKTVWIPAFAGMTAYLFHLQQFHLQQLTYLFIFDTLWHQMKNAGYTRQERSFIVLMRIWAAVFFLAGILFVVAPDYLPNYLTGIGNGLFDWNSPPLKLEGGLFWLIPSIAFCFTLSYLCLIAQRNLIRNIGYVRPVILAKFASAVGFLAVFSMYGRDFVFLSAGIAEVIVLFITWRFYAKAVKSRA